MKLKVTFSTDPTGFEQDITEVIDIPIKTCLFCNHDTRLNIPRLYNEVKNALESNGYNLTYYFKLFKVYVV